MHDTVIRGGTIVDGTGKQAFAIDGARITEVDGRAGARRISL
jgi:N-acyl-D-amino-acid deacylase